MESPRSDGIGNLPVFEYNKAHRTDKRHRKQDRDVGMEFAVLPQWAEAALYYKQEYQREVHATKEHEAYDNPLNGGGVEPSDALCMC